jgi:hypothetical protein
MMQRLVLVLGALLLIASTGAAQTARSPRGGSKEPSAKEKLVKALSAFEKRSEFVLDGKVSLLEADGGEVGMANTMVVIGGAGGSAPEFEGPIKVWRTTGDELIVFSKDRLPGFAFYDDGDRAITRIFFEESPVDVSRVTGEIAGLLDLASLLRQVKKAEFDAFLDKEAKTTTLQGALSRRLVKTGRDSGLQIMPERVLHVMAEFVLDSRDHLESFAITVVRSDPMAGLKRKVISGELGDGGVMKGLPEPSEEEGKCSVYAFKVTKDKPDKAQRDFQREVSKLLEDEDF